MSKTEEVMNKKQFVRLATMHLVPQITETNQEIAIDYFGKVQLPQIERLADLMMEKGYLTKPIKE